MMSLSRPPTWSPLLDEVATRCWVQWEQLALRVLSLTSTSSIPRFLTPTLAATLGDGGRPSVICNDRLGMLSVAPASPRCHPIWRTSVRARSHADFLVSVANQSYL